MAQSKSRLGRGLGSLIAGGVKAAATPSAPPATPAKAAPAGPAASNVPEGFEEIGVASISPSPYQARREIGPTQLAELTESIKAEGLLQPIVVRRLKDGRHELIAGERRWRAFQALKLKTIPARVVTASDASAAALGLIENLQREGLNPIEEAYGFASLIRDFDLTQEQAAERVGKGRASVANSLRLLSLDAELQGYLAKGLLSVGHAKVLLGVEDGAQRAVLGRRVVEEGLSVRGTETLVQARKAAPVAGPPHRARQTPAAEAAAVGAIEKKLTSHLGARVTLHHAGRKGRIVIAYAGNDDLQRILEKIGVEA
jgi:ParB family transcriptional regulator, chromosome partitioning protein